MGWSIYTHASLGDVRRPRPLAVCDRCGFTYNRDSLRWQYDWAGVKEMNRGVLVCRKCMDVPQTQLKTVQMPIDPISIMNPRPGEFSAVSYTSSPGTFSNTVAPSPLVVQSTTDGTTHIGDRTPIVTETSSLQLLTEITVTPRPDPGVGDGGYTRGAST